jgi:hypothetical protein
MQIKRGRKMKREFENIKKRHKINRVRYRQTETDKERKKHGNYKAGNTS